jgi:hypothetical protein
MNIPAAATTKAQVVEILKVFAPSPPVPQVSIICSPCISTRVASVRITSAAAVISATVSPLQRKAIKNPAICAEVAMHGKVSHVFHNNSGVFKGLNNPFTATRYHSLVIDQETLPDCLEVTAWTQDEQTVTSAPNSPKYCTRL